MKYIRLTFHSLWLFFPGILMVLIAGMTFMAIDQGRDLITTISEAFHHYPMAIISIAFWALLSWYSARIVAIAKSESNEEERSLYLKLYEAMPRLIGVACFAIMQIALLRSPLIDLPFLYALSIVVVLNTISIVLIVQKQLENNTKKPNTFFISVFILVLALSVAAGLFLREDHVTGLWVCFALLYILGNAFVVFARARRKFSAVDQDTISLTYKKRNFFFKFAIIFLIGFACYLMAIFSKGFSQNLGPLNYAMLAFGILLLLGNTITFLSIKVRLNLHLSIFIIMIIVGKVLPDYNIKTIDISESNDEYTYTSFDERLNLEQYFEKWYARNKAAINDPKVKEIPVYASLADGGASRSGYWVAQVLGVLQDSLQDNFSDHLFCISGASGGTVGNVTYYNLLHQDKQNKARISSYREEARSFLAKDFLTYTLSRLLSPFYPLNDRGNALEDILAYSNTQFNTPFSSYILQEGNNSATMPILYINTTRMQDSKPSLVSNVKFNEKPLLDSRLDVLDILTPMKEDIRLSSTAIMSSRFPYVSPAGGIGNSYFVDGGYFDNSGAGAVHETFLAFEKFLEGKKATEQAPVDKITFNIIHLKNSQNTVSEPSKPNPVVNDLFSPIITLAASYGQQTEINTLRLRYYIATRNKDSKENRWHSINLFNENPEDDKKEIYSMSWYMSEDCRNRMDKRLENVKELYDLIDSIQEKTK